MLSRSTDIGTASLFCAFEQSRLGSELFQKAPEARLPDVHPAMPQKDDPLVMFTPVQFAGKDACTHRAFHLKPDGSPEFNTFTGFTYAIETGLHEMLAQSPHRTLDPLEADFFYVPVYASCFAWPIYGWADTPW